jgi:hypothetical protein
MSLRISYFLRLLFLAVIASMLTTALHAQNIATAQLSGTVHDPLNAVLPGATVTITDAERGFSRTVTADSAGEYQFLLLPPGTYTVTASARNFSRLIETGITLTIGQQADLPLGLTVSAENQQITVRSNADIIETQRSSQSTTIDQQRIDNLPINGRNYINFTLTNSQIARDAAPAVGAIPTSGLNFGGVRARSNSINVDGADAGDYISGGVRATVSQDAVQEFQILTNGYAAEFGRAGGGVVNIVTRGGTNDTHGSAFGFLRSRYIQATNPFSTVHQPAYTRVQAGASIGGAIIPDKTFYFFAAELTRRQETGFTDIGSNNFQLVSIDVSKFYGYPAGSIIIQGTTQQQAYLNSIPTVAAPTSGLQQYVALVGSSSGIATTGTNPGFLQPTYGAHTFLTSGATVPTGFTTLNSMIGNFPISEKTEVYSLRLDHKLTDTQQLFLRANVSPSYLTGIEENAANQNAGENAFSRTATQRYHDVSIVGQHTWLLAANKVNELRLQYSRHPIRFAPTSAPGGTNAAVNIPGFAYSGKTPFSIVDRIETVGQIQDNFTAILGRHTIKTGIDLRYIPINIKQAQLYGGGDYSFAAESSSALGLPSTLPGFSAVQAYGLGLPQSFIQGIGNTSFYDDLKILGAFVQDTWRITPKLTANYGVRYDIEAFPTQGALNQATYNAERALGVREGIRLQPANVAPRVGLAFDPQGNGRTVIRANFGIFYDHAPGNLEAQSMRFNGDTVPAIILAGGNPCTSTTTASPLNLNAANTFQGILTNSNCVSGTGLNYIGSQQRFDPNNSNSLFVNQGFVTAGFPLAVLPSGIPADLNYHTPYIEQGSLGFERDLGHDFSLNVAYSFTLGRHLHRPINVNPVNPVLLIKNWQNAVADGAATASTNPLLVGTTTGSTPCGTNLSGGNPWVTPALTNFFRRSGLNTSLANFLTLVGAGGCNTIANSLISGYGLGLGTPVNFSDITPNQSNGTSNYNALSVNLKKRFSSKYEFLVSYTWSHAIDDSTDLVSTSDAPENNFSPDTDRSTSSFDQRHRLVMSGVYTSGHLGGNNIASAIFSNFTVAPIIEISSGRPFNILTGQDTNFDFNPLTDRPNAVAPGTTANGCGYTPVASKYSRTGAFNLPCYIDAPAALTTSTTSSYYNGNLGRNAGLKPMVAFTDLRIARTFLWTGGTHHFSMQATMDAFNLINKNNTLDVNLLYTQAGQPTASYDPRQFQFGLRASF